MLGLIQNFNKKMSYFCNASGLFGKELIECGLIAKYIIGNKNKIFRCELHCSDMEKIYSRIIEVK